MKNNVVLEKQFATTDTIGGSHEHFPAGTWPERHRQLPDGCTGSGDLWALS
jgi:hypothetical protein